MSVTKSLSARTLCQGYSIWFIPIKILQGHYHSHCAAETEVQARNQQIQGLHSSVWWNLCVFALLMLPFILPHFFSWESPSFSTFWIQLAILRKRWLTGQFFQWRMKITKSLPSLQWRGPWRRLRRKLRRRVRVVCWHLKGMGRHGDNIGQ